MAPVGKSDHDEVEKQLKGALQDLYQLMVQINTYDSSSSRPTRAVLENTINNFASSLRTIQASSSRPLPHIPPELIDYVDNGRNPDIYTREFVELARRGNQLMKGKMEAFGDFRDVLAREMVQGMPELEGD
ncbi:Mediator of RNA polymerase II transcription subunit, partial [Lachnellula hyalina]